MKTRNVWMLALLMAGTSAFAQQPSETDTQTLREPSCPMERSTRMVPARRMRNDVAAQLDLTPKQKNRLEKIREEFERKDSVAFEEIRRQQEKQRLERMEAFKSILTRDQLDRFEKMQLLRADREIFRDGNRPRFERPARVPGNRRPDGFRRMRAKGPSDMQGKSFRDMHRPQRQDQDIRQPEGRMQMRPDRGMQKPDSSVQKPMIEKKQKVALKKKTSK